MIKIGVIGVGSISHSHLDSYLNNPNAEIYALCDINPTTLARMAEKYKVPAERTFTSHTDLLKLSEIDAVSICTWNNTHASITIDALNAGKHVLCEKPMATNVADALAMKAAADKSGKHLQIGFVRRYGNDAKILGEFIENDYFGEIYYAKASYIRRNGNPEGWFGDKSRSGGGPLIDLGVHVIDLVRYLKGNPKPVSVYGTTYKKLLNRPNLKTPKSYYSASRQPDDPCDVEDFASAMIRFEDGFVLSVETSFSLNVKNDTGVIEFYGTKGGAKLSPKLEMYTEVLDYMADVNLVADTALSFDGIFQSEIDHFVDCIQNNTPCIAPAQDGVDIMKILCAIYETAESGHEVLID